jgi:hypothetical protein
VSRVPIRDRVPLGGSGRGPWVDRSRADRHPPRAGVAVSRVPIRDRVPLGRGRPPAPSLAGRSPESPPRTMPGRKPARVWSPTAVECERAAPTPGPTSGFAGREFGLCLRFSSTEGSRARGIRSRDRRLRAQGLPDGCGRLWCGRSCRTSTVGRPRLARPPSPVAGRVRSGRRPGGTGPGPVYRPPRAASVAGRALGGARWALSSHSRLSRDAMHAPPSSRLRSNREGPPSPHRAQTRVHPVRGPVPGTPRARRART